MSFLGKLFSGVEDVVRGISGSADDLAHGDFGGAWDRTQDVGRTVGDGFDETRSWVGDVGQHGLNETGNWWDKFKNNPLQLAVGAGDPFSTRIWNGLLDKEWTPYVNQWGGSTEAQFQDDAEKGLDTRNVRGMQGAAESIARPIVNSYTFGLGSSAIDAADAYGNKRALNGDFYKNAAANAAMSYIGGAYGDAAGQTNLGDTFGVTNSAGQAAINGAANGAIRGGVTSAATGDNVAEGIGKGAAMGGVSAGGKSMLGSMFAGDMPDTGTLGGNMRDEYGENTTTVGNNALQSDANIGGYDGMRSVQSAPRSMESSPVDSFIASLTGGGGGKGGGANYGGIASNLLGLYQANQQRRKMKEQQGQLQNLFSPNSPYAQQARQAIERKDAAGGRRSQYGPREAQIAALMANKQADMAPQLMKMQEAQGGYQNQMMNNGLQGLGRLYSDRGAIGQDFSSLMNLFGGR